jgi:hypothetical protein
MCLILQKTSIDVEEFNAIDNTNDECREQLFCNRVGSLASRRQQPVKSLPDQEYVRSMEELYRIPEEGIF